MSLQIFATRAKALRESAGLSLRSLARIFGISHVVIIYYENCKRQPTLSIIEAYADYFNVTTDYLLGRTDYKYSVGVKQ